MPSTQIQLAQEYQKAIVTGDSRRAEWTVRQLLAHGTSPEEIYVNVFAPALHTVGDLWQDGLLSVAEEHLASAITERLMGQLRPLFAPVCDSNDTAPSPRPVILVACVEGEQHRVGAQMIGDFFARADWEVLYLGADVPARDLVRLAQDRRLDVLALSVTMDIRLPAAEATIRLLRSERETVAIPVMVGGGLFAEDAALARSIGADWVAKSAGEAVALANAHVRAFAPSPTLRVWARPPAAKMVPRPRVESGAVAFLLDSDGRILWGSDSASSLQTPDETPWRVGSGFAGLCDNFSREKVERLLSSVKRGETLTDFELNHVVSAGQIALFAYSAFQTPDGPVALVGRDTGSVMSTTARLAHVNQELEGALSEMTEERQRLEARTVTLADESRQLEERWRNERQTALSLQKAFLGGVPSDLTHLQVAYRYQPAQTDTHVGGDFYDAISVGPNHVALVVADVSGKGLKAAVATVMVKYAIRAYAAENPDPASVLTRFNRFVCNHCELEGFVTVFYSVLNTQTGELTWCSAGHEPPLLAGEDGVRALTGSSLMIGAFDDATFTAHQTQMLPGEVLLAYSDGATEARPGKDISVAGFYGIERLSNALQTALTAPEVSAESVAQDAFTALSQFCKNHWCDDLTLLVARRSG